MHFRAPVIFNSCHKTIFNKHTSEKHIQSLGFVWLTNSSLRGSQQQNKTSWLVGGKLWTHCRRRSKQSREMKKVKKSFSENSQTHYSAPLIDPIETNQKANSELTISSCTLWLCQSWSWWGQCSLQLFLPATEEDWTTGSVKTNRRLQRTSWHRHLPLKIAVGYFFCFLVMMATQGRSDSSHRASKSNSSVTYEPDGSLANRVSWKKRGSCSGRKKCESSAASGASHCLWDSLRVQWANKDLSC